MAITSTAPVIDENGISAPSFAEILEYLQTQYRAIYGDDVYLGNDSQDGQFIGVIAASINDSNAAAVAAYNSFSPQTAQGVGLSSRVKMNGIERALPSKSTVDLLIAGNVGTVITNGMVADDNDNNWLLPTTVTIPLAGEITVTATAQEDGETLAQSGTITKIKTPTFGWATVNNLADAVPGEPVETDAALRARQTISVAVPSQTIFEGIVGGVANLNGVGRIKGYENDTSTPDSNGIPGHTIAIIAEGGDAQLIAEEIAERKTPGTGTFGSISTIVTDAVGSPHLIKFSRPVAIDIEVALTIDPMIGYSASILPFIKTAIADFINALDIGEDLIRSKLYVPANLSNSALGDTYNITALTINIAGNPPGVIDIPIDFDEAAQIDQADVTITVL
jgi:uncharacterized phage protein gp47/JayE